MFKLNPILLVKTTQHAKILTLKKNDLYAEILNFLAYNASRHEFEGTERIAHMLTKKQGFTLVELMITVVVAGILLAIAVPSLTSMYEQTRVNSNVEKIHNILVFARNQAVSYGTRVNVCSFASQTACGTSAQWQKGIRVYLTDAGGMDKELRAVEGFNTSDQVKGSTSLITFSSEGLSSGGEITYCPNGKATNSQSVKVSASGLVSYGATGNSC